jgi:hypothetical protein
VSHQEDFSPNATLSWPESCIRIINRVGILLRTQSVIALLSTALISASSNARALDVWAVDAMTNGRDDDSRIKSTSSVAQIAKFHSAKTTIGTCKKFSKEQELGWNEMTALANQGVVEAQTFLAWFGTLCKIVVTNRDEPMHWAEKAAATGYVPAFEVFAQVHEWPGIPNQSKEKAFKAYLAAAEGGSAAGMAWTRVAFCTGNGTRKDEALGAMWGEKLKAWYRTNDRKEAADKLRSSCY